MYTVNSPLLGAGEASAMQIQAWYSARNAKAPENLGVIIVTEASKGNCNSDEMAAQIAKETGFWTSKAATQYNNPAGLGITNNAPESAWLKFDSSQDGIHAMMAHWLTYIDGASNPFKADDPRYGDTESSLMFGKAKVMQDFEQHWAYTGPAEYNATPPNERYAATWAALCNELIATIGGGDVATTIPVPTQAEIGYPVRTHWAADVGPDRAIAAIKGWVIHDTEGSPAGDESVLTSAADPVESAAVQINPDGTLIYEVPITTTAWTPGNDAVAEITINPEISGHASVGYTDQQYHSLANFVVFCETQGVTVPRSYVGKNWNMGANPGFLGHADVPDPDHAGEWGGVDHHTDPGPLFDWDKFFGYMSGNVAPPAATDPLTLVDPVTGYKVIGGILARYQQLQNALKSISPDEVLMVVGRPVENEHADPDGVTRQKFEHMTLEWHKGASPSRFDILESIVNPYVKPAS